MKNIIDKVKIFLLCLLLFLPALFASGIVAFILMLTGLGIFAYVIPPILVGIITSIPMYKAVKDNSEMDDETKKICVGVTISIFAIIDFMITFVNI